MDEEIVNRVAKSNLVSFDLEELYVPGERVALDMKNFLYQELILKEKDFREHIKNHNWKFYKDKHVAVLCSVDAIIPTWAFMLISSALHPFAKSIVAGTLQELENLLFTQQLQIVDWQKFQNLKVVVKGCSKVNVPVFAYVEVVNKLKPLASSIMFGEACSTVPIYKKRT